MAELTQAPGTSGIRLRDDADAAAAALLNLDNGDHSMMLRCTAKALAQMVRLHACGKSDALAFDRAHLWHSYASMIDPVPAWPVVSAEGCA